MLEGGGGIGEGEGMEGRDLKWAQGLPLVKFTSSLQFKYGKIEMISLIYLS